MCETITIHSEKPSFIAYVANDSFKEWWADSGEEPLTNLMEVPADTVSSYEETLAALETDEDKFEQGWEYTEPPAGFWDRLGKQVARVFYDCGDFDRPNTWMLWIKTD